MSVAKAIYRAARSLAPVLALALWLGGCNQRVPVASDQAAAAANPNPALRPSGYSPQPAALAVTDVEGGPRAQRAQFVAFFDADAAQRQVSLIDPAKARYLAHIYISAYPSDGGTTLAYVCDVFDRQAHRAQRLTGEIALKGAAADSWSQVNNAALSALAAHSAQQVAAYLSNTPEAMAAAKSAGAQAGAQIGEASHAQTAPAQTLSATTQR